MALHPQCKVFLDMLAAAGGPGLNEVPLDEARKVPYQMIDLGGPEEPVAQVDTRLVPGPVQIPVRVYRPTLDQNLPALVFFHGGGFVICNLDTHDRLCRNLANASGCVVVSVDYRLAPEHKFPAAAEDAYSATRYVAEHAAEFGIDPSRIAVGGDSAGGNLAAVVAQASRGGGGPRIAHQALVYPAVDLTLASPSIQEHAHAPVLTLASILAFRAHYAAQGADLRDPALSPLFGDLDGLPPALVQTADRDPLRDDGLRYADALRAAGVAAETVVFEDMIHGFLRWGGVVDRTAELVGWLAERARTALP